jgi:hypothetical protein
MKKVFKHIWIILPVVIICIGFQSIQDDSMAIDNQELTGTLIENNKKHVAGDTITLSGKIENIKSSNLTEVFLQLSTSYGITVLSIDPKKEPVKFEIPNFITKKSGWIQWTFFANGKSIDSGSFEILPHTSFEKIAETYIGPPSIIAGGRDFTMIVATPTDIYDNLLLDKTPVTINEQRGVNTQSFPLVINKRIAWKHIFSPKKKGRIFATALLENSSSKEMNIDVFANQPQDFKISYERVHPFADGNQILTINTSILKDAYNNIITDGTLVQFIGRDDANQIFRTSSNTINGIASAKLIFPNAPTTLKIKASIPGLAKSQEIDIAFKSILKEFEIEFSENNRTITVGPLKSYLGQLIPDGAEVTLLIDGNIEIQKASSKEGFARFNISEDYYPKGNYVFTIKALGISKKVKKAIY